MATDNTPAKPSAKQNNDAPTIEVKEEKNEPKNINSTATVAKVEPRPTDTTNPTPSTVAKEAPKAATPANEQPKPAATAPKATNEVPKTTAPPAAKFVDTVSRVGRAESIVRRNVLWSLGAGVIPFPVFDAVAVTGIQLKMLSELSELYAVKFSEEIAKKLLASLLSSIGGVAIGSLVGGSLAKLVPVVGSALGIISVPIMGAAFTHATGKVFVMHFEAGGTLLDFEPHKMRSYFKQEFEKAKQTVADQAKTGGKAT